MRQVKAPDRPNAEVRIFLAGSIEMGKAEQWQQQVVDAMAHVDNLVILNPRRDDVEESFAQAVTGRTCLKTTRSAKLTGTIGACNDAHLLMVKRLTV